MWSSIKKITRPATLEEACALIVPGRKVIFSGGSYLVADRSPQIDTLIDVNHLLDDGIVENAAQMRLGTGVSLQEIVNTIQSDQVGAMVQCTRWSCPSKNIRNQRTLGGEIGRRRVDSELYAYLYALNATLHTVTASSRTVAIRDWDGDGIVTAVEIQTADIRKTAVQRFALLPSAPAFVIVVGIRREQGLDLVVAGKANRMSSLTIPRDEYTDEKIAEIASSAMKNFGSDQYGTIAYKEALIQTGLRRVRDEL